MEQLLITNVNPRRLCISGPEEQLRELENWIRTAPVMNRARTTNKRSELVYMGLPGEQDSTAEDYTPTGNRAGKPEIVRMGLPGEY